MTDDQAQTPPEQSAAQGSPIPRWAYRIMNPIMATIIRSPLHRAVSGSLMLLIFDGRKSGKRYVIPVGYVEDGNTLYIFSHSNWAKNFSTPARVGMRLRGNLVRGTAQIIDDPALTAQIVERFVHDRGPEMAQQMGLLAPGPDGTLQTRTPAGTTFIAIERATA